MKIHPKKIHVVTSIEEEASGPSYSVTRLAEEQAALGSDVGVYSLSETTEYENHNDVKYYRFARSKKFFPGIGRLEPSLELNIALNEAARQGSLLHMHGLWRMPNVYPGYAANKWGAPLLLSPRGMLGGAALAFSHRQKQLFWHFFQKQALRKVVCFHATAEAEVEDIRRFGLTGPVAVIPNGIDVNDKTFPMQPTNTKRQVLHLGRIHPKKGIDRLLRAWAMLDDVSEGWELRVVGPSEGGHMEYLQKLARDLSILTNVRFEPPMYGAEKAVAYAKAELFVLPTLHENFGMVVAEALVECTPVISTIGAPWQGLETERCGWWIEHGSESLAATLREAMALDDATRACMGARGRDWMQRDFSWNSIAEKMDQLYNWFSSGSDEKPEFVVN